MQTFVSHTVVGWLTLLILSGVSAVYGDAIVNSTSACEAVIERDVIVVGGGSGGTFASVRLAQHNKSVAVLEEQVRLGGNVATYIDPTTNSTFDYGVQLYSNISVARDYLAYLGIDTISYFGYFPGTKTLYVDETTGKVLPAAASGNATAATDIYLKQMEKYGDLFSAAGFEILPDPIPEDLLLPWGEWLTKYNATAFAYDVFYVQVGNALEQLTLYIMKAFNLSGFKTNAITTAATGNQIIYNTAYNKLGGVKNVFLGSQIQNITRSTSGVVAIVKSPTCGIQTFKSKQLVIAIRPKYKNLEPFLDIREDEANLTKQFKNLHTWTAALLDSGIPLDTGIELVDTSAEGGLPNLPTTYGISSSGIPLYDSRAFWWGTNATTSAATAEKQMLSTVDFVRKSLNYSSPAGTKPTLSDLKYHTPYFMHVAPEAIADGFYKNFSALQGRYNTFWTGAAWESENSASIWKFTEDVMIPALLKA